MNKQNISSKARSFRKEVSKSLPNKKIPVLRTQKCNYGQQLTVLGLAVGLALGSLAVAVVTHNRELALQRRVRALEEKAD